PTGCCINAFADKIQKEDRIVPIETSQIERRWTFFGRRFHPKTQIPINVDSIKKASNPSIASNGPKTSPTKREYVDQLILNIIYKIILDITYTLYTKRKLHSIKRNKKNTK